MSSIIGPRPLAGIRVVDATANVLGPYCTMLMAQLGADVIKIEPPAGEMNRSIGAGGESGLSAPFQALNRGKRSVVLDLRDSHARLALDRLVDTADVFIHSMRADAARRLGLDGASLRKSRPRLVYCAATGYGEDGPYAGSPAYDDIIQASSGIAWLQGTATNGGEPRYVATIIADKVTGLVSLYSILAALLERERTGTGLAVEVPMFETMVSFLMIEQLAGMSWEPPRGPPVYNRTVAATRRPYRTSDGYLSVMPYTDRHWHSLFDQLGHPELIDDPRLNSTAERSRNIDFAYSLLEEALPKRTTDEWLSLCRELDIPAARINSIEDLFHDPHLEAVKMFTFDEHVAAGRLRSVRSPVLFEGEPLPPAPGVPALGQHTVDLLREVGCSEESVADLLARSVAIDGC